MCCKKNGKIIVDGTNFCHDCAETQSTTNRNHWSNAADYQEKSDDLRGPMYFGGMHFEKNGILHNRAAFPVELGFTLCDWLVIIFGAILLGLYIFVDFRALSGFTSATIILSMILMVIFFLCGFICVTFASVEIEGRRSSQEYRNKSLRFYDIYNNKYLRSSMSENIMDAKVKDLSLCKKLVIINGALIFIFCLVMSGISLFGNIDYGYGELNFLNSILLFFFFLLLGHLYLAFSFIVAETSHKSIDADKKSES